MVCPTLISSPGLTSNPCSTMSPSMRVAKRVNPTRHNPGSTSSIQPSTSQQRPSRGRNSAVAQLGRVHLSGFPGWVFWLAVHLVNVVSFRSRVVVLVNWAWEYIFYDRPVRLIVRART